MLLDIISREKRVGEVISPVLTSVILRLYGRLSSGGRGKGDGNFGEENQIF